MHHGQGAQLGWVHPAVAPAAPPPPPRSLAGAELPIPNDRQARNRAGPLIKHQTHWNPKSEQKWEIKDDHMPGSLQPPGETRAPRGVLTFGSDF